MQEFDAIHGLKKYLTDHLPPLILAEIRVHGFYLPIISKEEIEDTVRDQLSSSKIRCKYIPIFIKN